MCKIKMKLTEKDWQPCSKVPVDKKIQSDDKVKRNVDFDQRMACRAPVCWSKYTTAGQIITHIWNQNPRQNKTFIKDALLGHLPPE